MMNSETFISLPWTHIVVIHYLDAIFFYWMIYSKYGAICRCLYKEVHLKVY